MLAQYEKSFTNELLPNLLKKSCLKSKIQKYPLVVQTSFNLKMILRNIYEQFNCQVPYPYLCSKSKQNQQHIFEIKKENALGIKSKKTRIRSKLNKNESRLLDLANEKGASSWLNATPLK